MGIISSHDFQSCCFSGECQITELEVGVGGKGQREKFLTVRMTLLITINEFLKLHWEVGRWEMGQNQSIYRMWGMTWEFGLVCKFGLSESIMGES